MNEQAKRIYDDAASFWIKLREELVIARESANHDPDYDSHRPTSTPPDYP